MPATYAQWLAAGQPGGSFYNWATSPAPATAAPATGLPNYSTSPAPHAGQGPYGLVPGNTQIPPSTFSQFNTAFPGLSGAPDTISANIMSELQGEISPQALRNMQDAAARFGVSSGMPGSNAIPGTLANNANLLGNILTTQQLQRQGQADYLGTLAGVGAQQINPALAAQISESNAALNAAPDPAQAAAAQLANYYAALNSARGPGGGSGYAPVGPSGTGSYSPASQALGFGFGSFGQPSSGSSGSGNGFQFVNSDAGNQFGADLFGDLGTPTSDNFDYSQAYANPEDYYAGLSLG